MCDDGDVKLDPLISLLLYIGSVTIAKKECQGIRNFNYISLFQLTRFIKYDYYGLR